RLVPSGIGARAPAAGAIRHSQERHSKETVMKVAVCMFSTDYTLGIVPLAQQVEALGFESLWLPEHPLIPVDFSTPYAGGGPLPDYYRHSLDPFAALAAAAAATTKLRLGTGICLLAERNPLIVAKEVATVDLISGGRFELGVGAGWLKEEGDLFKVDWPHRWAQTKDHVLALKALWGPHPSQYQGRYVQVPPVWCNPKPVQKPNPPVLIAGELEQCTRRVAEYGDGWIPRARNMKPQDLEQGRKHMEAALRQAGRDPAPFRISLFAAPPKRESNRQFADAGCDRVIHMLPVEEPAKTRERLKALAADVL
ncbi:MAG TPA: TIGR03619 family F420-dependent LLM class oxidoreductase, partial [bacterium]|nr:TIGR03619 family F420-dependent LLM class oxidoreductase [bacterium]